MKSRVILLLTLGVGAAALALVLVAGRTPWACPAIGYAYVGEVELLFSAEPVSVAACFGDGCAPEAVTEDSDGKWWVPQSPPYLTTPVSVTSIYVEAVSASDSRIARVLQIETESTGNHPFALNCGGPFRFKPVHVPLG
ncbi:hypothetical protein [Arthrobacter alpinus]|uniref:hypothetical protein n=1 Tax=Arthrobacter alpinus TaxID=656366 RepID=UPI000A7193EC|nr:hypothetical protein [Arthrobacter alpinus]